MIIHFFNKNPDREENRAPQHQVNHEQILVQCSRPKAGSSPTPSSSKNDLGSNSGHSPSTEQSIESLRTFVNCDGEKLVMPLGPRIPGSCFRRDSEEMTLREASLEQNINGSRAGKKPILTAISNGNSNNDSRNDSAEEIRPHPLSQG
jgi:hypothetical protein